jgi:hypothetical protein
MKFALLLSALMALTAPFARAYPPYYDISQTEAAKAEAQARQLPIAYLGSFPECLTQSSPNPGSFGDLSQMALAALQGKAVVIFFDGHNMAPVPMMVHMQYHQPDDGPLDGGAAWTPPKIVFTDPAVTKILGRVSHTQMTAGREAPILAALAAIQNDPASLQPKPHPAAPPPPPPGADSENSDLTAPQFGTVDWAIAVVSSRWQFFVAGFAIFIVALIAWAARNL